MPSVVFRQPPFQPTSHRVTHPSSRAPPPHAMLQPPSPTGITTKTPCLCACLENAVSSVPSPLTPIYWKFFFKGLNPMPHPLCSCSPHMRLLLPGFNTFCCVWYFRVVVSSATSPLNAEIVLHIFTTFIFHATKHIGTPPKKAFMKLNGNVILKVENFKNRVDLQGWICLALGADSKASFPPSVNLRKCRSPED